MEKNENSCYDNEMRWIRITYWNGGDFILPKKLNKWMTTYYKYNLDYYIIMNEICIQIMLMHCLIE